MKTATSLRSVLFESKYSAFILLDTSGNVLESNRTFKSGMGMINSNSPVNEVLWDFPFWNKDLKKLKRAWKEVNEEGESSFSQELKVNEKFILYQVDMNLTQDGILVSFSQSSNKSSSKHRVDKEKLASLIFHDLRAPVSNVAYLLSIFHKQEIGGSELAEFIDTLKKSNNQTLKVVDRIADLMSANIKDSGELTLSLRGMIDSVLRQFKDEIASTNARVVVDIHDQEEWKLPVGAFQMILGQVISNSLRYAKSGQTPKIVITCSRKNRDRVITVSDNGVGFDIVENEHRLFGLFQTFHDHPDARGIGLFQVKNRLLSIGGEVSLDSQKGIGTTVTLNFKQNELEEAPLYH